MAYEERPLRRQRVRYNSANTDNPLKAQLVRAGAKVTPSAATITIYAPGNSTALVSAAAMTISGTIASYSVSTTSTDSWPIQMGYRADISATVGGVVSRETIVFDVVRHLLHIPVGIDQLLARDDGIRGLVHNNGINFESLIEAARDEIQLRLEVKALADKRLLENMILDSSQLAVLFRLYVLAAIWNEKRDYDHADRYTDQFRDLFDAFVAGIQYDTDQSGHEETRQGGVQPMRLRL